MVRQLHEGVRLQILKKNRLYASKANKGRKLVVFQPGDWVWVHMRKEQFPNQRKSKLQSRGDGPFQVLERINDNAYKIVFQVSMVLVLPLMLLILCCLTQILIRGRILSRREGMMWTSPEIPTSKDPLYVPNGSMTRSKTKALKEALNALVLNVSTKSELKGPLEYLFFFGKLTYVLK